MSDAENHSHREDDNLASPPGRAPRPVPELTPQQRAFYEALGGEEFSLENVSKRFLERYGHLVKRDD